VKNCIDNPESQMDKGGDVARLAQIVRGKRGM